jgi:dual-specificity kinase
MSHHADSNFGRYFRRGRLDYPTAETTRASRRFVKNMKRLDDIIPHEQNAFYRNFLDLLRKIFVYDPASRISALDALQHPWFKEIPDKDDGTAAAVLREERRAAAPAAATRAEHG